MTTPEEIAKLKAEAAEAAAEAARLKAESLAAKLAAAEASLSPAATPEVPTPAPVKTAAAAPAKVAEGAAAELEALEGYAAEVAAGYTFDAPAIEVGTLLVDGAPEPRAKVRIPLKALNRHGLVAGATGTGKTRTLQLLAESLSANGIPVFITDIKGDLTGLAEQGVGSEKLLARTAAIGQEWEPTRFPLELFTLGGQGNGIPIRTTITDFGHLALSRVLGLNETQEASLALMFHWSDQEGYALKDLKDLKSVIQYLTGESGKEELKQIGGVSPATAGVILRQLAALEAQGASVFFGEPAFDTSDFMRTMPDGRGVISALELPDLGGQPAMFSTFIMWLLAELFEKLPEVGDPDKPKLVFFFDEAHLLFHDASKDFLNSVVQTVRLIRSKGVGVFFVTQSPKDIPEDVLAQLGSRLQHALRAHTPQDAERLAQAVKTYPKSPYNLAEVLQSLGTGEAVVTVLGAKGAPTPVAATRLFAPQANMGVAEAATVAGLVNSSPLLASYQDYVDDPATAFEMLQARMDRELEEAEEAARKAAQEAEAAKLAAAEAKQREREEREKAKANERLLREHEREVEREKREKAKADEQLIRDMAHRREREEREAEAVQQRRQRLVDNMLTTLGREITRSIFGNRRR